MAVRSDAGDRVASAPGHELHRKSPAAIFVVLVEPTGTVHKGVNERPPMKGAVLVDETDSRRRGKRSVPVLLVWRVRRNEAGAKNRHIQDHEKREPSARRLGAVHGWSARKRGSVAYSSASATKLPARSSSVEDITAPMTRY